jgi:hypothetical protein
MTLIKICLDTQKLPSDHQNGSGGGDGDYDNAILYY